MYVVGARIMEMCISIMQMITGAIIAIISAVVTVLLGYFIERRREPELHIVKLDSYRFENSIRLYLVVENRGLHVARNTTAYLTILLHRW